MIKKQLIACLLSLLLISTAHAKRIALVIGNKDYQVQALRNPINDAQDITKMLKKAGFQVSLKLNASQAEMEQAILKFGLQLDKNTTGLFYYSGHGIQHNGTNYLLPIGAMQSIAVAEHLRYKAVSADYVLSVMNKSPLNIMILDACRDSPFKSFGRGLKRGLARMDKAEGVLIAYSTAPGETALDGQNRNSPYTEQLLNFMQQPGLSIESVLKKTRSAVKTNTDQRQTPWYESAIDGEFSFISGEPINKNLILTLRSNLNNDWVKINGINQGSTRLDLALRAGHYQIQIGKDGYQTFEQSLNLQTDKVIIAQLLRDNTASGTRIKRYIAYDNGTAKDTVTGLTWMRCSVGQRWENGTCTGKAKEFNWEQARQQTAIFAGHSDWRIPTIEELGTLVYCSNAKGNKFTNTVPNYDGCWEHDGDYDRPTIVQAVFPHTGWGYWSGSPYAASSYFAWNVDFNLGSDSYYTRSSSRLVRLVRGGQ